LIRNRCACAEKATLPIEVLATLHLPKNRRINIDRALESIFDAIAVDGSIDHVDAVFIRVYRGTK